MKAIIDIHTHTYASGHAYSTLQENVYAAAERGLKIMAVTDHAPKMPGGAHIYYFWNLRVLPEYINNVRILRGVEANILNIKGKIDIPELLADELDICLASFHPPCYKPSSGLKQTKALINTLQNKNVKIIGHPGDERFPFEIEPVIDAARSLQKCLEINNASLAPYGFRPGGKKFILRILEVCAAKKCPVVLGSDAHYSSKVGDFQYAEDLLEEMKFPADLVLNYNSEKFYSYFGIKKV
ncbi:MAG: phosphatase [Spirochaetes bacterium]|nr:phosphatase [Spirochaetota bacterium]